MRGDIGIYLRALAEARPYWVHILGISFLTFLATPLALLAPLPFAIAVDTVVQGRPLPEPLASWLPSDFTTSDTGLLMFAAILVVLLAVASGLASLATTMLRAYTGERLIMSFRGKLFRHSQRLSLSHHDRSGTADMTYRLEYDARSIQDLAVDGVIPIASTLLTLASMLYITYALSPLLAFVALAVGPALFLVAQISRRRLRQQSRKTKVLESQAMSSAQESLSSLRVVKAFGQEDRTADQFIQSHEAGITARLRLMLTEGWYGLLTTSITAVGTAAVLFIGVSQVNAGVLTLGSLMLVMGYLSEIYGPLRSLARKTAGMQSSLASAERVFDVLDEEPEVAERPDARPIVRANGAIQFAGVSFSYDKTREVLHDASFVVPPSSSVAITGHTGAGKSTIASLLLRFYDPVSGAILLDGVDLRDYRLEDLRQQFSIVLQEPVLFSASILENIAYARPDASFDDIVSAAKAASIHTFISELPDGYESQVGQRGVLLSGGERQRLSIARAFLKDAPLLILDEPTSSVDIATESLILSAIRELMKGRTSILITHRLTAVEQCDIHLVMKNGRVVSAATSVPDPRDAEATDSPGRQFVGSPR